MIAIPNGCSMPLWGGDKRQKENIRNILGFNSGLRYFIFVGRFSKEKNPDMIIKAFEELRNEGIGVVLLGSGDMYNELKSHECDNIIIPGFKSNVYDYMIASDYYISASDVEGLANTLLESMTVGLPCVLSDIPSHREVITKTTQPIGFSFNNKNLSDLKDAIHKVLELDIESTSLYIRDLFQKYYTAKNMSETYQKVYVKNLK